MAQGLYNRNFDDRLRRQLEVIKYKDFMFLRVERKDAKLHLHKLAPITGGPYTVNKSEGNTVVIKKDDRFVEHVSLTRVILAPTVLRARETRYIVQSMTDEEFDKYYPSNDSLP